MLTITYDGLNIFTVSGSTDMPTLGNDSILDVDYKLILNKGVKIVTIRRFITRELMVGLDYRCTASRLLACAIYAAFAHPAVTYTERTRDQPLWFVLVTKLMCEKARLVEAAMQKGLSWGSQ